MLLHRVGIGYVGTISMLGPNSEQILLLNLFGSMLISLSVRLKTPLPTSAII